MEVSHTACKDEFRLNPRSHKLTFFYFLRMMFKVNNRSQQELLLSCCLFDHVSSNINKLWLLLYYLRVPFHQLASLPAFYVTHIPKGNLVNSIYVVFIYSYTSCNKITMSWHIVYTWRQASNGLGGKMVDQEVMRVRIYFPYVTFFWGART